VTKRGREERQKEVDIEEREKQRERGREMYSSQRDIEMKAPLRRGREVYGQKGSYCTAEGLRHRPGV
jgi:hypothetical protein